VDARLRHARRLFDDLRDQVAPERIATVNRLEGIVAASMGLLGDLYSYQQSLGSRTHIACAQLEDELNRLATGIE
jgi:hypothetical protein